MSWHYLLIVTYALLFLWVIPRFKLFQESTVPVSYWRGLFLVKILLGIVYSWYHLKYIGGGDTWHFFWESGIYFESIHESWKTFLALVFGPNGFKPQPSSFLPYTNPSSFWWDDSEYLLVRINTFLRLLSFGNYYVHLVFWNFGSLLGLAFIYRFFSEKVVENAHRLFWILALVPSILFWGSGLHKEGLSLLLIGNIIWQVFRLTEERERWIIRSVLILVSFFFLGVLRIYLAVLLLPSVVAFVWVALTENKRAFLKYVAVYLGCVLLSMVGPFFDERLDIYARLSEILHVTRVYFPGKVTLEGPILDANKWWTFYTGIPRALYNVLLKPSFFDSTAWYHFFAFVETYLIAGGICLGFFRLNWKKFVSDNRSLLAMSFGLSLLIIIGLVSINIGAIVRYRTVALVFVFAALFLSNRDRLESDSSLI